MLSFVRRGVLHQLLRLEPPRQPSNGAHQASELALTIESPMRLQSFASLNQYNGGDAGSRGKAVELRSCDEYGEEYKEESGKGRGKGRGKGHGKEHDSVSVARFMGQVPCKNHSEQRDIPNGREAGLKDPSSLPPNPPCPDCSKVHWQAKLAELVPDKTNDSEGQLSWKWQSLELRKMESDKMDHISKDKDNVTSLPRYQAHLQPRDADPDGPRVFIASFCLFEESGSAVGRPTEGSADAPPKKRVEAPAAFEQTPPHQEITDFVGIGPSAEAGTGTAAMWEAIFDKKQDRMDPECIISELPEVRIVGRCLEKILGVDVVPTTPSSTYSALVSNMFLKASVDLKSLL
jgi:hypothetical protein